MRAWEVEVYWTWGLWHRWGIERPQSLDAWTAINLGCLCIVIWPPGAHERHDAWLKSNKHI